MKDDYVEVCLRMIEGTLRKIDFRSEASVSTCVVPKAYGTGFDSSKTESAVDLGPAESLAMRYGIGARLYPMDLRLEGEATVIGSSRTLAAVGTGSTIREARAISEALAAEVAGPLRYRADLAGPADIKKSRTHIDRLRKAHGASARLP